MAAPQLASALGGPIFFAFISAVAVLLASISTAVIGPISFLGLIVPHIARLLDAGGALW